MGSRKRKPESKKSNLYIRVVHSLILLILFAGAIKMGKLFLLGVIGILDILVFSEFIKVLLGIKLNKSEIPVVSEFISEKTYTLPVSFLWWCFISIALLKGGILFPDKKTEIEMIFVPLQIVWMVWFLWLLRGGMYKMKFFHLSLTIVWALMLMYCTEYAVENLNRGIFYFVLPCALVSINDTGAYIVGKTVGCTPLINISPKKTVEGFLGGGIITVVFSIPASKIIEIITSEKSELSLTHICVLAGIASLVAPIGGIFASGYKRAFGVKNFGTLIPGHGGISDRIDCQLLMQLAAGVFLSQIQQKKTFEHILNEIRNNLTKDEIFDLIKQLLKENATTSI